MYIGIDLGTSSIKSIIMDEQQNVIDESSIALTVQRPKEGFSEQDPAQWWYALQQSMNELKRKQPQAMAKVKAIGFSGQMHGLTLLDSNNNVLRPAILWNDGRCGIECAELKQKQPLFLELGGNDVMPGFTAPKLEWVRKHQPEIFMNISKILLPKDYIRFCLSGDYVSEMSDAAGTLWLNVAKRDWADELLVASQITRQQLPSLVEGSEYSSYLNIELCKKWGLPEKVILAGGAGDNAAAACGLGAVEQGDAFISLGTSGVIFIVSDKFAPNPQLGVHAFCHALPNLWHQMAVILSATDSVNWLSEITNTPIITLMSDLGTLESSFDPNLIFLPYISGERTPHNNPDARGAFIGLARSHNTKDLAHATIEGVAFALAHCLQVLQQTGSDPDKLMVVGGGAQNDLWLEMIATLTDKTILLPDAAHLGAAFGAARLAMAATGAENVFGKPHIAKEIHPNKTMQNRYQQKLERFKLFYPALSKIGHQSTAL